MEQGDSSDIARLITDLDSALAVDPLTRRKWASMAELHILNFVFHCIPTDVEFFVDENGNTIKRVVLNDPLNRSEGEVNLDRMQTPDGQHRTVIDMSGKGWGVYAINNDTGEHTYFKNGVEKRARHRQRNKLARKLFRLEIRDNPEHELGPM